MKPLDQFHRNNRATGARTARGGQGVDSRCKVCKAEARKPGIHAERAAKATLESQGMKICGKCKTVKPYAEFHKRVASPDGLALKCKCCVNEDSAQWRQNNPSAHEQWYQENKERKSRYFSKWRSAHKETEQQRNARWARENPHKVNALIAKRVASKLRATPAWANQLAIEAFYAEAARLTKETGERHEVDHIVPLQGKIVRGLHWEGNLQVLPKAENISKHNRRWPDMPC